MNPNNFLLILFQLVSISVQDEVCKLESDKEASCSMLTSSKEAAEYGTVQLDSLFVDGKPDPSLVDVQKMFFIEVNLFIQNFLCTFCTYKRLPIGDFIFFIIITALAS
jgi:hypothetical protein